MGGSNDTADELKGRWLRESGFASERGEGHGEIDAVVLRTIVAILSSFGIEEEDRRETREIKPHENRPVYRHLCRCHDSLVLIR